MDALQREVQAPTPERRVALLAVAKRLERQSSPPPPPLATPSRATELLQQAERLARRGETWRAIQILQEAATSPRHAACALHAKGRLERRLGRQQVAIASMKQALHGATETPGLAAQIYADIGDIYAQRGEADEAAYYLRRACRIAPGREDLLRRLSSCVQESDVHDVPTRPNVKLPPIHR